MGFQIKTFCIKFIVAGVVLLGIGLIFVVLAETLPFKKKKGAAKRAMLWIGLSFIVIGVIELAVILFQNDTISAQSAGYENYEILS